MEIKGLPSFFERPFILPPLIKDSRDYEAEKQVRAYGHEAQSTGISIVTTEGDHVTIQSSSERAAYFSSYDYLGRNAGRESTVQAQSFQFESANSLSISVEGELSEAELADIQQAISQTQKVFRDGIAGDGDETSEDLQAFDGLETISSLDASFSFIGEYRYEYEGKIREIRDGNSKLPPRRPPDDRPPAPPKLDPFFIRDRVLGILDEFLLVPRNDSHGGLGIGLLLQNEGLIGRPAEETVTPDQ